ncbi:MAG: pre-toxin TG domain-containing protein [Prochloraceae cyanobacterium]
MEAEEGQIEFSLEIERDDDDGGGVKGIVKGGIKGIRNIAGNVLNSLIDAGTGNLADILSNQIGLKIDKEDLQDIISGEEGVGEILEDLGRKNARKLAEYPLQLLKDVFSVDPQQALDLLNKTGLNSGQIDTLNQFFNNEIASSQIGGNLLGLLPTDDLIALGTPFGGLTPFGDSFEQITVVSNLIEDARDGEIFGQSSNLPKSFLEAWDIVYSIAIDFYEQIKGGNWNIISSSEFKEWEKAVDKLQQEFLEIGYGRGSTGVFNRLEQFEPNNEVQWKEFFQDYATVLNLIVEDRGVIPLSDAQRQDYRERFSDVLDFTPFVGDIKGIAEALSGRDLVTGEPLEKWEQVIGAIPFLGGALKKAGQNSQLLVRLGDDVYGLFQGTLKDLQKLADNLADNLGVSKKFIPIDVQGIPLQLTDELVQNVFAASINIPIRGVENYVSGLRGTQQLNKSKPINTLQDVLNVFNPSNTGINTRLVVGAVNKYLPAIRAAGIKTIELEGLLPYIINSGRAGDAGLVKRATTDYLGTLFAAKFGPDLAKFVNFGLNNLQRRNLTSLRGPSFEKFVNLYVPGFQGLKKVDVEGVKGKQQGDSFIASTGELWDFKFQTQKLERKTYGKYIDAIDKNALDFNTKQKVGKIQSVNFLFASEQQARAGANVNNINNIDNFNIFYLEQQSGGNFRVVQL